MRRTWGLQYWTIFCCGISVILILNGGIAVFSKPVRCGFLAFWTVLIISSESSNVFQTFSSFQSEKDIKLFFVN